MAIQKDAAFVLKRLPLRETSLLVTLFCRDAGKIKVVAKGVRREKNPLTVRFEPFTHLSIVYYEKTRSDIHLLSQSSILDTNVHLRNRLDWFGLGSFMIELVDALFNTHDPHPEVYELLAEAFRAFPDGSARSICRAFELKVLGLIGWLPELSQCAACGTHDMDQIFFSARQGGIVCRKCQQKEFRTIPISRQALETLQFYLDEPLERTSSREFNAPLAKELDLIGDQFLQFRLDYPLRSRRFLYEIQAFLKN